METNSYQTTEIGQKQLSIRLDPLLKERFLRKVRQQGTDVTKVLVACIEGYVADEIYPKNSTNMVALIDSMDRRIAKVERAILEMVTE